MERPKIEELHKFTLEFYQNCIPMKIGTSANDLYWFDLNIEFSDLVFKEGLSSNFFLGYEGFLHEICACLEGAGEEINKLFQTSIEYKDEVDSQKRKSIKVRFNIALSNFENQKKDFQVFSYVIAEINAKNKGKDNGIKPFINLRIQRFYEFLSGLGLQVESLDYFKLGLDSSSKPPKTKKDNPNKTIPDFNKAFKEGVFTQVMERVPFEFCEEVNGKYIWKDFKSGHITEKLMMGAFLEISKPLIKPYDTDKDLVVAVSVFFNFVYKTDNYSKFKTSANRDHCLEQFDQLRKYVDSKSVKK